MAPGSAAWKMTGPQPAQLRRKRKRAQASGTSAPGSSMGSLALEQHSKKEKPASHVSPKSPKDSLSWGEKAPASLPLGKKTVALLRLVNVALFSRELRSPHCIFLEGLFVVVLRSGEQAAQLRWGLAGAFLCLAGSRPGRTQPCRTLLQ